jgi:hypothetical protein
MATSRTARKPVRRRNPSSSITPNLIAEIADMTDRNDHTGSVLALAEALKAREQEKVLRAIMVIQNYMMEMPRDLSALRHKILNGLLATAKREVGPVAYRHLHEAF